MKSNFKRLMGLLLTVMMIVTMIPVTSLADNSNSAKFVVNGETFVLMDGSAVTHNGKTYYGVLAADAREARGWGHGRLYFRPTSGDAGDKDVCGNLYFYDDYLGALSDDTIVNVNDYVSYYTPFDGYIIPSNYKMVLSHANSAELYHYGSISMPSLSEIQKIDARDSDIIYDGAADNEYIITRDFHFWSTYYFYRIVKDGTWDVAKEATLLTRGANAAANIGGVHYFMTYVSEDFFRECKIEVDSNLGGFVKKFLTTNYTKGEILGAGLYTGDELREIGFEIAADDLKVTGVELDKTTTDVGINNTVKLTATILPSFAENRSVKWSSADPTIASVENGVVTGLKEGKTTIRAASAEDESIYAECEVNVVLVHADSVELDKDIIEIYKGYTEELTATVKPDLAYDKEVTWTSSNDSVATVKNGVVKGIKQGTATITVTTVDGGKTDTCEVIVKEVNVTGVELDKDEVTVYVGDKETLTAVVSPEQAEDKAVRWSSDNESVAVVIGGVVEGIGKGIANITATTVDGGYSDTCVVTVNPKDVTGVELDQNSINIIARETVKLTATVMPEKALNKAVVWTSSDEEIVTVDEEGNVTGVAPGSAVIKAASAENESIYAECAVKVNKVNVAGITLDKTAANAVLGTTLTLKATVIPDTASVLDVIWTSSDETVATVVDGNVTPKKTGVTKIVATSADDNTKKAECEVTVINGHIDSPNYLRLENGIELLFNEVKKVGGETYFSFTIAKDYAGSTSTRGLYWVKDSVDPLGNPLNDNMYGEYFYQAGDEQSMTDVTLDTMLYGFPEAFKDHILLNDWSTGFQYALSGLGNGIAKSKTYFCLPSEDEIKKHSAFIANMVTDNTNSSKGSAGPQVVIIREGGMWEHYVYSISQGKKSSAGQGLAYIGGSVFPTFYVNIKAFGETKFDLDTVGADVKAAIMTNIPRSVIRMAGYDPTALVDFGYVEDILEVTDSTVVNNTADINWNYINKDTVPANAPIIMAVAYDANNKMLKAVPVFPANPEATVASNASLKGNVVITTTEAPAYIMLYALKNSTVNPFPLADAVVTGTAPTYAGSYSANAVDFAISTNAEFTINGTIASNASAIAIVTKPGKTVADLGTSAVGDVILNIALVKSDEAGRYGFAFAEDKANVEYLKYTAGIYTATDIETDAAIFKDSGFDAAVKNVYSTSTLDEFVAIYGDTLDIDKAKLDLLTSDQKAVVKAAINVGSISSEAIGTAINNKAGEVFVTDAKANLASQALASFAVAYGSKLDGLDVALAVSVDATQEANIKAAVVIENDDTPKEIADKINKELAAQVVSKATTGAQVVKALAEYNKHLGLDLENWIDKKADGKDVLTSEEKASVYQIVANGTYTKADDVKAEYEKAVLITRINKAVTPGEIPLALKEYADSNGMIHGVDVTAFDTLATKNVNGVSFVGSLDQKYTDWANFVTVFNNNVDLYTSSGSGSGSGGFGGGGAGGTHLIQFTPGVDKELIQPSTPKYMFADLGQAEWAVTYVEALAKLGHINGKGNNTFCPNDSIKREEVVKILVSALGLDVSATEASFADVDAGAWYAPYLAAAKASGIVNGKPDGSFGIGAEITREELATMIYRAAGLLASETDVEFADEAEIADYAKEAVSTLVAAGVINGKGNNQFAPKANATRAEASKIIYLAVIGK